MINATHNGDSGRAPSRFYLYVRIIETGFRMSDAVETGNGLAPVQRHQFDISDEDGPAGDELDRSHNGLVRVTDGAVTVMTAIHTGDVERPRRLPRLRNHTRSRDTAIDQAPDTVTEWYLITAVDASFPPPVRRMTGRAGVPFSRW
ncbi:hypothetical protein SAMN06272735_0121 [Streptomyces sp. TLI_55]|uniref:hypothetical protein n=1 Tax=Streptomyces sp. TLI_55 TaxID=1938861 RepID=UPI000BCE326C|nr:hypothetical protein [Streptomyces sp. TLI_55]SNX55695.1 hypothetical protein SAMN06272735_0121 [Streptomyces sp. TLI_55]